MLSVQGRSTGMSTHGQVTYRASDQKKVIPNERTGGSQQGGLTPRGQLNLTGSLMREKKNAEKKDTHGSKTGIFSERKHITPTKFRAYYERGDLPVVVDSNVMGIKLRWKVQIEDLDYNHYLPIFFDGLRETKEPYATIGSQGIHDLLHHGEEKIVQVVPQLIIPIKCALDTRNRVIMCRTLRALQHLVLSSAMVGEALVPYYRQILPVMNVFKNRNNNTGDGIDYSQHKGENLGDLIDDTLQLLEQHGGEDAFINIKYMIPTYESCLLN